MGDVVRPTWDLAFRKILASEEYKDITAGFIGDFFGLRVGAEDIYIAEPYSIKTYQNQMGSPDLGARQWFYETSRDVTVAVRRPELKHADVADVGVGRTDVTVELQISRETYFAQRAFYYLADLYASHYREQSGSASQRYGTLGPVWSLNIVDFPLFGWGDAFHMFVFRDEVTGEVLRPQLVRFGFFELSGKESVKDREQWRRFLADRVVADDAPSYLKKAARIIEYANLSPEEREMDKLLQKGREMHDGQIDYAMNQGREQGIAQGVRDTRLAAARAAFRWGVPREGVMAITGLDAVVVDGLARELGLSAS